MKTLGIVGGLGPESTVDYYRSIITRYRERKRDGSYPALIIDSLDFQRARRLVEAEALGELAEYLLGALQRLASAGADFGLFAAVTPHIVFDAVCRESPIPLLSIVEATCATAKAAGFRKVGLLGTRFTMGARFFPEVFEKASITLVVPTEDEQAYIHDRYLGELVNGVFRSETREQLVEIIRSMKKRESIDAVILGGTELPLILRDAGDLGIPFLDTALIHVQSAVEILVS